jgi:hypothetical protein
MDVNTDPAKTGWETGLPRTGTFANVDCNDPGTTADDRVVVNDLNMYMMVNTWFPRWVEDKYQQGLTPLTPPMTDKYTYVDYIRH